MTTIQHASSGPYRVAVLCGGDSSEREISLESGNAVATALSERHHKVTPIDPSLVDVQSVAWDSFDAAFIALHGAFGEDGQIQTILDELGVPYTGSDATASRLAFSKSASKERFVQEGLKTPAYVLISQSDDASRIEAQARKLGYPLVVKPDSQGSSLGVTIVESPTQLPAALSACFHRDSFGILERAVLGDEWTVAVIDSAPLPPIRIETPRAFYDYRAKYQDDSTDYLFEQNQSSELVRLLEVTGVAACDAVGTHGVARVDLRLDRFGQPWILEVNTVPGFTGHSLVPKAAARTGMDLGALCELSIRSCIPSESCQRLAG